MGSKRIKRKARESESDAIIDLTHLLGYGPFRRDLLLEYLHAIQDAYGCLSIKHLVALAEIIQIPQVEVYETATFYAYFDIVGEAGEQPPITTIRICDSLICSMHGGENLLRSAKGYVGPTVRVQRAPCMGRCDHAPIALVNKRYIERANGEQIQSCLAGGAKMNAQPLIGSYQGLSSYLAEGGYEILKKIRRGEKLRADVLDELVNSGLKGLGGAGFSTGRKWGLINPSDNPLMAVNADEGEPGTFKDRHVLTSAPHQFLEGVLIAAAVGNVREVYIYLRAEYPDCYIILQQELKAIKQADLIGDVVVHLRRGAGAYICGEESAMLESLEGKRGEPRHKPPFPTTKGLFGRPTLVNNVETLYWIPRILKGDTGWSANHGKRGTSGWRLYSVSGRVAEPGVKLAPIGVTARELIDQYSGGISDGHVFKAYLPGGASGGLLPAFLADLPLDFNSLDDYGCFVGSGALIILGQRDSIIDVNRNLMKFFEDESCGQCTPCRVGCTKMLELMAQPKWDKEFIGELSNVMADASICGLGQAAPTALLKSLQFFDDELPT
tara:strand:- start:523 stop:2184 length:1662 start_codon:yes stop_codon:yes gene_type:complete